MIELPKNMTIKKTKVSTTYTAVTAIAIYHALIIIGFAVSSFVMMENRFIYISFFDWDESSRAMYIFFYIPILIFAFALKDSHSN